MEEIELLKIAKTDKSAVEELLKTYKPLVIKLSRRYFLAGGELDDLVQEGMIGLYNAINSFDEKKDASFKTFATLCITRRLQSAIRRENTQKNKVFLELFDTELMNSINIPSDRENPEARIISQENYEHINSEIEKLLSKFEYDILKKYLSGLSYDQIADESGVSKKSVDNALSRLRAKLSHLLDDIAN